MSTMSIGILVYFGIVTRNIKTLNRKIGIGTIGIDGLLDGSE